MTEPIYSKAPPSDVGLYYWRETESTDPIVAEVWIGGDYDSYCDIRDGVVPVKSSGGLWGPRVPTAEEIVEMREQVSALRAGRYLCDECGGLFEEEFIRSKIPVDPQSESICDGCRHLAEAMPVEQAANLRRELGKDGE